MRLAMCPATTAPCATASGTKASTVEDRNPRPPTRSGCVGATLNSMRDTCQRKRAQMNNRKYQRQSRNWKSGRLTQPYHHPASEAFEPSTDDVAYQVAVPSAP